MADSNVAEFLAILEVFFIFAKSSWNPSSGLIIESGSHNDVLVLTIRSQFPGN
ncbi:hypothetical protein REPUB_Repub20aG0121800 [Reevesia pubescens]